MAPQAYYGIWIDLLTAPPEAQNQPKWFAFAASRPFEGLVSFLFFYTQIIAIFSSCLFNIVGVLGGGNRTLRRSPHATQIRDAQSPEITSSFQRSLPPTQGLDCMYMAASYELCMDGR